MSRLTDLIGRLKANNPQLAQDIEIEVKVLERRLLLAKQLLNPNDSVLIVTIDQNEVSRLHLLLEQTFPEARIVTLRLVEPNF